MESGTSCRGPKWSHEETLVLAELKREAKNEGKLVWIEIAQKISNSFPGQTRLPIQCRRRWETLIKVHNCIQKYCLEKGKAHWMLNEGELSSMKLDTAYRQDWYDVVEHVCSQRKRKEKPQGGSIVVKRSKISESISTEPSSEDEKVRLEEEIRRLTGQLECKNSELERKNFEVERLKFQVAQLRQASQEHQAEQVWETINSTSATWENGIRYAVYAPKFVAVFFPTFAAKWCN